MENRWELCIGGVRGSIPVTGEQFRQFGGDTMSLRLRVGDQVIYIDAGTGLLPLPEGVHRASLLIGHAHVDHMLGLSMWSALKHKENEVDVYMAPHEGMDCRAHIDRLWSAPLWPIRIPELPATTRYHDIEGDFRLGDLTVRVMEGNHPNGVTHFRISDGERSLVYAVDTELTEDNAAALAGFARDCDLLICDGQYTDAELAAKSGWGHSSMRQAAELGAAANAAQTLLIHYDPESTDEDLLALTGALIAQYPRCRAAHQGETIIL